MSFMQHEVETSCSARQPSSTDASQVASSTGNPDEDDADLQELEHLIAAMGQTTSCSQYSLDSEPSPATSTSPLTSACSQRPLRRVGHLKPSDFTHCKQKKRQCMSESRVPTSSLLGKYAPYNSSTEGDIIFLLNVPVGFIIGCDASTGHLKDKSFEGFRGLPNGPHYVWVADPGTKRRCGCWIYTQNSLERQIHVKEWNSNSGLLEETTTRAEKLIRTAKADDYATNLSSYGFENNDNDFAASISQMYARYWAQATSRIHPEVLRILTGKAHTNEWLVYQGDTCRGEIRLAGQDGIPSSLISSRMKYSFPHNAKKNIITNDITPDPKKTLASKLKAQVTSSDATEIVIQALESGVSPMQIIGELQFSFITAMTLANLSAIDQWWHMVLDIILQSHKLIHSHPALCADLIKTIRAQLVFNSEVLRDYEVPIDGAIRQPSCSGPSILQIIPSNSVKLMDAIVVYKKKLKHVLKKLGSSASHHHADVAHEITRLESHLRTYAWQDVDENDDDGKKGLEKGWKTCLVKARTLAARMSTRTPKRSRRVKGVQAPLQPLECDAHSGAVLAATAASDDHDHDDNDNDDDDDEDVEVLHNAKGKKYHPEEPKRRPKLPWAWFRPGEKGI